MRSSVTLLALAALVVTGVWLAVVERHSRFYLDGTEVPATLVASVPGESRDGWRPTGFRGASRDYRASAGTSLAELPSSRPAIRLAGASSADLGQSPPLSINPLRTRFPGFVPTTTGTTLPFGRNTQVPSRFSGASPAPTTPTTLPTSQPPTTQEPTNSSTDPSTPATSPPTTEPTTSQPPATEPPTTQAPTTEPPTTQPPATDPPTTQPPATEPPSTEPPPTTEPKRPTTSVRPDATAPTDRRGSNSGSG